MIRPVRGMLALALALIVPAQGAAACCLLPRSDHAPAHAARHGHAAPRHLDATGHAAARGWTADPGAARIPCFVPAASSAALRQRSGDTTGAPGPTPFATVDTPPVPFTTKVVAGAVPLREPSRGSFRPLRL